MSIGNVLTELLKKFNLNALELERLTGVPSSTIYRLLKDKGGNPTIDILKKLSSFFQITVSQLIGEEPIGCKQIPLVQPSDICSFLNSKQKIEFDTIPIDFPLSGKCFATLSQDNMMEPFILVNSIIIIDPECNVANKDFVLLIKNEGEKPIIRQIISDGDDFYLKILNSNFPIDLKKIHIKNFYFIGVIIHYRTNLFNFGRIDSKNNLFALNYDLKK